MSFSLLPDRVVGYATYELAERLAALTPQQRAAIDRIVEQVYICNRPLADLLRGDDKICSERRYYDKGRMDDATGHWRKSPGWHHDPAFQAALNEARRLALMARTREELAAWQDAKRRARLASGTVVDTLIGITAQSEKDGDRVKAGQVLLAYGAPDASTGSATDDAESEWWEAADDE